MLQPCLDAISFWVRPGEQHDGKELAEASKGAVSGSSNREFPKTGALMQASNSRALI